MWDWSRLVGLYLLIDTALACIGSMRYAPLASNGMISLPSCVMIGVIAYPASDHRISLVLITSLARCPTLDMCFPCFPLLEDPVKDINFLILQNFEFLISSLFQDNFLSNNKSICIVHYQVHYLHFP